MNKLHYEAVSPELKDLLLQLMKEPRLDGFHLVGGTALALRFGHRRSIDIDLFASEAFNAERIIETLEDKYPLEDIVIETNTVNASIRDIKLDLIAHRYPLIDQPVTIEGIRMLSLKDLAAMKLNAIANRGSRKDFWDCAELLEHWHLQELLRHYREKYPHTNIWQVQKSLCYFDDAEFEPDPKILKIRTWEEVKALISQKCQL
ncbi:MAG: nucleotidyl transferase AbiEii/AbiGii toxin family protein [Lentisphaeria bacterium]